MDEHDVNATVVTPLLRPSSLSLKSNMSLPDVVGKGMKRSTSTNSLGYADRERAMSIHGAAMRELCLLQATVLVEDAKHARTTRRKMDSRSLKYYKLYFSKKWIWFIRFFILIHLSLAFFEQPTEWDHDVAPLALKVIELLCLSVYGVGLGFRWQFSTKKSFLQHKWTLVMVCVLTFHLMDVITNIAFLSSGRNLFQLSRIIRPFYMAYHSSHIRKAVADIGRSIPGVTAVMSIVFFMIAVWTMVCEVAFLKSKEGREYFPTFIHGFINMYICLTTANYPDVMWVFWEVQSMAFRMPAFTANWFNSLFFVLFLMFLLYFLMNLVLAVVYNHYRAHLKVDVQKRFVRQQRYLKQAFHLLTAGLSVRQRIDEATDGVVVPHADEGRLRVDVWIELWGLLKPKYDRTKCELMFDALDVNHVGFLKEKHFLNIVGLLSIKLRQEYPKPPFLARCIPSFYYSRWNLRFRQSWLPRKITEFIRKDKMDPFINALILVNGILTIIIIDRNPYLINPTDSIMHIADVQAVMTYIFVMEQVIKVSVFGPGYFRVSWNVFDFVIVVAASLDNWFWLLNLDDDITSVIQYFTLFRAFRLVRVVGKLKQFKVILSTFGQLLRPLATYWGIQFCLFYAFVCGGFFFFADKIQRTGPNQEKLVGSSFDDLDYYANNFNSVHHAFITLFEIMVTNNWHVIVDGYARVTSMWAWLFFIVFHVITVNIITNIVVAFTLEVFIMQWELNEHSEEDSLVQRIRHLGTTRKFRQDGLGNAVLWVAKSSMSQTDVLWRLFAFELEEEHDAVEEEAAHMDEKKAEGRPDDDQGSMVYGVMSTDGSSIQVEQ